MVVDKPKVVFVKEATNEVKNVIKKGDIVMKPRTKVHPIPTIIINDYSSTDKAKKEIVIHPKEKGKTKCKKFYFWNFYLMFL